MSHRTPTQRRGLFALIGALVSLAVAAPPSLAYTIPTPPTPGFKSVPVRTMADTPGTTGITFGVVSVDTRGSGQDISPIDVTYEVYAKNGNTTASASYNTKEVRGGFVMPVKLYLSEGRSWTMTTRAVSHFVDGSYRYSGFSGGLNTLTDFTPPLAPSIYVDPSGVNYSNQQGIRVTLQSQFNDPELPRPGQGEIAIPSERFTCTADVRDETCPFTMSDVGGATQARVFRDLPETDGVYFVYARLRDSAEHPRLSNAVLGFSGPQGNASPAAWKVVGLDTQPPVPKLKVPAPTAEAGSAVSFDASGTTDQSSGAGVDPSGFEWTFGDNVVAANASSKISHTYPGPGTYNGSLTVRDRTGNVSNPKIGNPGTLTFKVTIYPKGQGPLPTTPVPTTPAVIVPTTPEVVALPPVDPPAPESPQTPLTAKADIGLIGKTTKPIAKAGQASATEGALALIQVSSISSAGKIKPNTSIPVKVQLREEGKVTAKMIDAKGHTAAQKTVKNHAPGTFTMQVPAVKKTGKYTLQVKSGDDKLTTPVTVAKSTGPSPSSTKSN